MSPQPNIQNADDIIYGWQQDGAGGATWEGFAQDGDLTITPDCTEEVIPGTDGKTRQEKYTNPFELLSADFVRISGGDVVKGQLVYIKKPGATEARAYVVTACPVKYDAATGQQIVSLTARHYYSMAAAYAAGPIDPTTSLPYSGRVIEGIATVEDVSRAAAGVSLSAAGRTVVTDANGFFRFTSMPTDAAITISAIGVEGEVTVPAGTENIFGVAIVIYI